jgi:hypothetical protein
MNEIKRKIVILFSAILIITIIQTLSFAEEQTRLRKPKPAALISMSVLVRSGTIKITQPDRTVLVIEPNQALPDIFLGSKVEVISGELTIMTDNAQIIIEANEGVRFSQGLMSGETLFTVTSGNVEVITSKGEKITLGAEYSYYIPTGEIVVPVEKGPNQPERIEASPYTP